MKVKVKLLSRVQLFVTPWAAAYQAPLSMEFSRQEFWSGLPVPSSGDLPHPGINPGSPTLQAEVFTNWAIRDASHRHYVYLTYSFTWHFIYFLIFNILFFFWPISVWYGILNLPPGIKPVAPAVEVHIIDYYSAKKAG